jgi:DHA3 family macrolide efflux protein-like MFS transporter
VLLAMLARSTLSGFHWPAMQAATSMMVPERHLARVGGINQAMFGLANVVAAPAGAVLIAMLPMWAVLSADLVTAMMAVIPLLFIPVPSPERREGRHSLVKEMKEGLAFLRGWQGALSIIVLFMIANLLLSPAFSLLPLLVVAHFGAGAAEYAAMESLAGIGMLVGGLALGIWGGGRRKVLTMLGSTVVLSLGVLALGVVPADLLPVAYACCLVIGGTLAILNGSMMAMMQASVPFAMQGRVFALISSGVAAMMPAGLLLAGPLSDIVGVQVWYLIAGIPMAALSVTYLFIPKVMEMELTGAGEATLQRNIPLDERPSP